MNMALWKTAVTVSVYFSAEENPVICIKTYEIYIGGQVNAKR